MRTHYVVIGRNWHAVAAMRHLPECARRASSLGRIEGHCVCFVRVYVYAIGRILT